MMRTFVLAAATTILAACGGSEGGGTGGAASSTGTGGTTGSGGTTGTGGEAPAGCATGASELLVKVGGKAHVSCDPAVDAGGLTHVIGKLDDGHLLVVNLTGQKVAKDLCIGMGMRLPTNSTTINDWQVVDDSAGGMGQCTVDITEYGARVVGTFSATLAPVSDTTLGDRVLTEGSFDVACTGTFCVTK